MSELSAALVAALKDLTTVEKGNVADTGKYSYSYADIADVVALTRPVLAEHGLVALTPVHAHDGELACTVELIHSSGEAKKFDPLPFPPGKDAQATGSAITYHRRYALLAALGMAADEDDDGAKAVEGTRTQASGGSKPATDKQIGFAKKLAADLGEAAKTVVPSIVLETTGREAKLVELTAAEISKVIEELKVESDKAAKAGRDRSQAHDDRLAEAAAKAESGDEPFPLDDERPF